MVILGESRRIVHLKNLSKLRKEKGFTQEGLARKADISYHTLIKIESGRISNPRIETVIKLADALDISIDKFNEFTAVDHISFSVKKGLHGRAQEPGKPGHAKCLFQALA